MVLVKLRLSLLIFLSVSASLLSHTASANTRVNIVGLFSNKAVMIINDGKPKTLSVGQSVDGVKLIAADSSSATLLIEGKTTLLGMGQAASVGEASANNNPSVTLYASAGGHFVSECKINGAALKFLIDTGATTVALNSGDAKFAKIDYKKGEPVLVSTANGVVTAYRVTIANLKIGGITLSQVEGSVLEGGFPSVVLMGMSALNRMEVKHQGSTMTLTKKY
ncbi:TIGR02281 family clan AA aspartic protease [Methylotenera oryzisoli]|uniref:TIGR02281 family clan AA aspartic protease n=1 Tax=Methylotenera oryzisoli TaxID=2080758 RepID=A0A4Y9VUD9_9PROT|nr:TIGR02281 family clan AA aspartic protease [Methylotenera oryzisoli]TFW73354.1 TIGR02281 family clan AA aspartic protease [Methylotenera oryzisoli]